MLKLGLPFCELIFFLILIWGYLGFCLKSDAFCSFKIIKRPYYFPIEKCFRHSFVYDYTESCKHGGPAV